MMKGISPRGELGLCDPRSVMFSARLPDHGDREQGMTGLLADQINIILEAQWMM